jgi:hypothetical protein
MDRQYWTKQPLEAEQELRAARGRIAVNAAARRLQRASAHLKNAVLGSPDKRGFLARAERCIAPVLKLHGQALAVIHRVGDRTPPEGSKANRWRAGELDSDIAVPPFYAVSRVGC